MNSKNMLLKLLSLTIVLSVLITACGAPATATQAPAAATKAPEPPRHLPQPRLLP